MANIRIQRHHHLGMDGARKVAWQWVVTDVVAALRRRRASVEGRPSARGAASEVVVADRVAGEADE